jgi:hypothetical protein
MLNFISNATKTCPILFTKKKCQRSGDISGRSTSTVFVSFDQKYSKLCTYTTHGVKWRQEQLLLKRFLLLVQVLDRDAMGSIYAKFAAFLMKTVI